MLELHTLIILCVAAFLAGSLNALAGGGTLITLPALIFAGLPPVIANATSASVVLPGYASAAFGLKNMLKEVELKEWIALLAMTVISAIIGAQILVRTSNEAFSLLAPLLVLLATALFALGPRLTTYLRSKVRQSQWLSLTGIGVASAYGGYFNGGLGIALLAVLQFYRQDDGAHSLNVLNGIKSAISFVLTSVSVLVFAFASIIHWQTALLMMLFSTAGGYAGARFSLHLPSKHLRHFVIALGLTMSSALFYRFLIALY